MKLPRAVFALCTTIILTQPCAAAMTDAEIDSAIAQAEMLGRHHQVDKEAARGTARKLAGVPLTHWRKGTAEARRVLILQMIGDIPTPAKPAKEGGVAVTKRYFIAENVEIKKMEWELTRINIMKMTFVVANKNDQDAKDIAIRCNLYGKSGTKIQTIERVIYEIVKAGKTATFRKINFGFAHSQAHSGECSVIGAAPQKS